MAHRNRYLHTLSSLLLAVSTLAAVPALAVDSPTKAPSPDAVVSAPAAEPATAPAATPATPGEAMAVSVNIPSIEATDSSIDGATLKAILSGDFAAHAADLAKLTATSIRVPEIDFSFTMPAGGKLSYVYKDVDVESVSNGVAQSISFGSAESTTSNGIDFKFGKVSTGLFDIGGLLAFYGLVPGSADQPLKTLYKNFDAAGGNFVGPGYSCDVGEVTGAEFKARPLKVPFGQLISLLGTANFQPSTPPPPAMVRTLVTFYIDFFRAFESSPLAFKSIKCSTAGDVGAPHTVSMGPVTLGGFASGMYPSIDVKNLSVDGVDGSMSLGDASMKSFDISAPLKVLDGAPAELDADWFTANVRNLIPAFAGFAFSDFKMDIPDQSNPGQRIKLAIGDFDLSLADYFGGVPTTISTSAHHVVVAVPPAPTDGSDDQMAELRTLGIDKLDLGYDLGMHRDATAKTIVIDKLAVNGANLGSVSVGGTFGNALDALFTGDKDSTLAAAMALTVKTATLEVVDAGLADLIMKQVGAPKGMDLKTTQVTTSGMAQAVILATMGGTPAAKTLADALGKFIAGGKSISVTATAKDPAGLSLPDFEAAQSSPAALADKVTIDAVAK